jgi:hypothetical protein
MRAATFDRTNTIIEGRVIEISHDFVATNSDVN